MSGDVEYGEAIEGRSYVFRANKIRIDGTSIDLNPLELTAALAAYLDAAARKGWRARDQRGLLVDLGHQRRTLNKAFDAAIKETSRTY